jgi:hypothetical protein
MLKLFKGGFTMLKRFKYLMLVLAFNQRRIGIYLGSLLLAIGGLSIALSEPTVYSTVNVLVGIIILIDAYFFMK